MHHHPTATSALTGSGVVVPVYLRPGCGSGRVTWLYPTGALRIVLKRPRTNTFESQRTTQSNNDYDFRWPYNDVITPSSITTQRSEEILRNKGGKEFKVCVLVHNIDDESAVLPEKAPSEKDKKINFPARYVQNLFYILLNQSNFKCFCFLADYFWKVLDP